jgi:hypothetical protein
MSNSSPASQAEATEALRALFTAFPSDKGPVNGFAATFLMAVEGYSQQAIRKAVTRLIRGEFDWFDGRFLPTPAQVSRACKYCEDLIAPPKRMALPAPGDVDPTEEEWTRRKAQADAARDRFGIKPSTGETVVDREAMPEALRAERDKDVARAAAKLREGSYQLSDEAMAIFREGLSDRVVPSPDEQFDHWNREAAE